MSSTTINDVVMNNLDCLLGSLDRFYGMYRQVSVERQTASLKTIQIGGWLAGWLGLTFTIDGANN